MSLVRFYDGHFNIAIHTDHRIGRTDEVVIWLNPVKNRRFNDSVVGVDRRILEGQNKYTGHVQQERLTARRVMMSLR